MIMMLTTQTTREAMSKTEPDSELTSDYRVIRDSRGYTIRCVVYTHKKEPWFIATPENYLSPYGKTLANLERDLQLMAQAFRKPVLSNEGLVPYNVQISQKEAKVSDNEGR